MRQNRHTAIKKDNLWETWISERTRNMVPSASVSIADKIRRMKRQGLDIIELQTGDPDFATPEHIIQAAYEAMRQGYTHYVSSQGIPELREAIVEKLWNENKIKVDPDREVLITPGAVHAVSAAIMAMVNQVRMIQLLEFLYSF